jgi:hypothetical protein
MIRLSGGKRKSNEAKTVDLMFAILEKKIKRIKKPRLLINKALKNELSWF